MITRLTRIMNFLFKNDVHNNFNFSELLKIDSNLVNHNHCSTDNKNGSMTLIPCHRYDSEYLDFCYIAPRLEQHFRMWQYLNLIIKISDIKSLFIYHIQILGRHLPVLHILCFWNIFLSSEQNKNKRLFLNITTKIKINTILEIFISFIGMSPSLLMRLLPKSPPHGFYKSHNFSGRPANFLPFLNVLLLALIASWFSTCHKICL